MREAEYQSYLKKKLRALLPGCMVLKNDPNWIQGIPDLLVLYKDKWASLEVKKSAGSRRQPNQDHYVQKMNEMSFSAFIYPENEEEILSELQRSLEA